MAVKNPDESGAGSVAARPTFRTSTTAQGANGAGFDLNIQPKRGKVT